jgi:hypothetical protein
MRKHYILLNFIAGNRLIDTLRDTRELESFHRLSPHGNWGRLQHFPYYLFSDIKIQRKNNFKFSRNKNVLILLCMCDLNVLEKHADKHCITKLTHNK